MKCPKCGTKVAEKTLYCPQCGHRFQLDPIEGQVMSVEEWKLKKFREKDQTRKEKMQANKDRYKSIEERMYAQQAGFDVEDLEKEHEEKKNEEALTETTPEIDTGEGTVYPRDDKVGALFDFEGVASDIKKKGEGTPEKKQVSRKTPPIRASGRSSKERAAAREKRKKEKAKASTLTEVLIASEEEEGAKGEGARETGPLGLDRPEAVAAQLGQQTEEGEQPKRRRRRRVVGGGGEEGPE